MRSRIGFLAAISFLSAVPIALLAQLVVGGTGAETMIHFFCGLGFVLSSMAVFDFRPPRWMNWIGSLSTGAVGAIFLLQGVSNLLPGNQPLSRFAFQVLGQGLEGWLIDLFMLWLIAVLFMDSHGRTRVFGFIAMSIVLILELYRIGVMALGGTPAGILKLAFFLAIVWLLMESRKKPSAAE